MTDLGENYTNILNESLAFVAPLVPQFTFKKFCNILNFNLLFIKILQCLLQSVTLKLIK